jgi:hypothetical protein
MSGGWSSKIFLMPKVSVVFRQEGVPAQLGPSVVVLEQRTPAASALLRALDTPVTLAQKGQSGNS